MRLLDKSAVLLDLAEIGFENWQLEIMDGLITRSHGIVLVTGPTGSGKTTTLYAALAKINSPDLNILTIEDPVEIQLKGVGQVQVNAKIDLTFAERPALLPAPGPRRHHGRRDPRPGDRRDRHPGLAHRPPGALHRPHQRRRRRHHPPRRHGRRALPGGLARWWACWPSAWCACSARPAAGLRADPRGAGPGRASPPADPGPGRQPDGTSTGRWAARPASAPATWAAPASTSSCWWTTTSAQLILKNVDSGTIKSPRGGGRHDDAARARRLQGGHGRSPPRAEVLSVTAEDI